MITSTTYTYNPHLDEYGAMAIIVVCMFVLLRWYFTDELPRLRQERAEMTYEGNLLQSSIYDALLVDAVEDVFAVDNQVYNIDEEGGI